MTYPNHNYTSLSFCVVEGRLMGLMFLTYAYYSIKKDPYKGVFISYLIRDQNVNLAPSLAPQFTMSSLDESSAVIPESSPYTPIESVAATFTPTLPENSPSEPSVPSTATNEGPPCT